MRRRALWMVLAGLVLAIAFLAILAAREGPHPLGELRRYVAHEGALEPGRGAHPGAFQSVRTRRYTLQGIDYSDAAQILRRQFAHRPGWDWFDNRYACGYRRTRGQNRRPVETYTLWDSTRDAQPLELTYRQQAGVAETLVRSLLGG